MRLELHETENGLLISVVDWDKEIETQVYAYDTEVTMDKSKAAKDCPYLADLLQEKIDAYKISNPIVTDATDYGLIAMRETALAKRTPMAYERGTMVFFPIDDLAGNPVTATGRVTSVTSSGNVLVNVLYAQDIEKRFGCRGAATLWPTEGYPTKEDCFDCIFTRKMAFETYAQFPHLIHNYEPEEVPSVFVSGYHDKEEKEAMQSKSKEEILKYQDAKYHYHYSIPFSLNRPADDPTDLNDTFDFYTKNNRVYVPTKRGKTSVFAKWMLDDNQSGHILIRSDQELTPEQVKAASSFLSAYGFDTLNRHIVGHQLSNFGISMYYYERPHQNEFEQVSHICMINGQSLSKENNLTDEKPRAFEMVKDVDTSLKDALSDLESQIKNEGLEV